jgi:zinc D-Ala-D-Ala dipeptidase
MRLPETGLVSLNELDMGTSFDCFDTRSATSSREITKQQQQNRATLVAVMQRHGFYNYSREWWHFSFRGGSSAVFDFDIPAGPNEEKQRIKRPN